MISIQYGMRFIVSVTVLILTFSFTSCDTNKGSDNSTLLVLLGLGPTTTAMRVYGQGGSFTSFTINNGGVSATSLYYPSAMTVDKSGNLFVADYYNHRVLYYNFGSTTATWVYGQGNFTTNTSGCSATSLNYPSGVAVDGSGNLYVADYANNRVLYYHSGSTTATRVYGQGGSFTTGTANNGGISETTLNHPYSIAVDGSGNLYVADSGNNRVLYYNSGSTTATKVYGQPNFSTSSSGCTSTSLNNPDCVALDSNNNLYVADTYNNRVLYYGSVGTTATRVYGQSGSFTTGTANNGGISATTLYYPESVAVDRSDNVYVADYNNHRVLYYSSGSITAARVYGQGGSFTTRIAENGGISANALDNPSGVAVDEGGNLYVADFVNNRILYY